MKRKPRNPEQPILPTDLLLWLGFVGLVMAAATIGVIAWAEHDYDTTTGAHDGHDVVRTANLFYSFCERDELQSVFSLDVLRDRKFLDVLGRVGDRDHPRAATRPAEPDPRNGRR